MPTISGLGHVGLYCSDLALQEAFYTEALGLTKTDEDRRDFIGGARWNRTTDLNIMRLPRNSGHGLCGLLPASQG